MSIIDILDKQLVPLAILVQRSDGGVELEIVRVKLVDVLDVSFVEKFGEDLNILKRL